jgi:hypothetical protein
MWAYKRNIIWRELLAEQQADSRHLGALLR